MVDFGRRARRAGDLDQLVDRLEQLRSPSSRMWLMYMPPHSAGLAGQRDQLVGVSAKLAGA